MLYAVQTIVIYLQNNFLYSLAIVILALGSVLMLGYEFLPAANPELIVRFQQYDLIIAFIFLADFFLGLIFNTSVDRKTFFKQNWLNLISSIPVTSDITRALRILRIFRAFRVIRVALNFWFAESRLKRNLHKK